VPVVARRRQAMPWVVALGQAAPGEPIFLRIVRAITEDIRRGRLTAGTRLPGTRTLARSLGVNRNTVVAAFDELVAEGWLTPAPASGTRVSETIPEPSRLGGVSPDAPRPRPNQVAEAESPVGDQVINLSAGYPDLSLLPAEQLARAYRRAVKFAPAAALGPRNRPRQRSQLD
jgi:GntR family transcriptional regulator/MocR family aminotransferase